MASLQLRTLNCQRATLLIRSFLQQPQQLPSPRDVARRERVWEPAVSWLMGVHPLLGARLDQCGGEEGGPPPSEEQLEWVLGRVFSQEHYALCLLPRSRWSRLLLGPGYRVRVLLHAEAGPEAELKAFFHAHVLMQQQQAASKEEGGEEERRRRLVLESYQLTAHRFPVLLAKLRAAEEGAAESWWDLSRVLLGAQGWRLAGYSGAKPGSVWAGAKEE